MAKKSKSKKSKKPEKQPASISVATVLLILLLLGGFGWNMNRLQQQVDAAELEQLQISAQVDSQKQANETLRTDIAAGGTSEQMSTIAREELGLVAPGEKVFYDVSN